MPKIRIATIIWKDAIGGAERSLSDLAAALDRSSFDMRFFYLSGGPGVFAKEIESMGYQTVYLNWKSGFDITGRLRLLRELKRYNPHLVHDHIIPPMTRILIKILLQRPIINTEHGSAIQRAVGEGEWWRRLQERLEFKTCDCIAANSKASANSLRSMYGVPWEKIRIVYLGINLSKIHPTRVREKKPKNVKIGFLGRIVNSHKGADYLPHIAVELASQWPQPFRFVVGGDGPDREYTATLCRRLGVVDRFRFLGWVSDVKPFLEQLDLLVIPSRYEPLGLVAIEALALNVPVVAFSVGGLEEILGDCPSARLVEPGDTKAMAKSIIEMYEAIEETKGAGRLYVSERFSNEKMANELGRLYFEILKQRDNFEP